MKKIVVLIFLFLFINITIVFFVFLQDEIKPDNISINEAVIYALEHENVTDAVITLNEEMSKAFFQIEDEIQDRNNVFKIYLVSLIILISLCLLVITFYFWFYFIKPFSKLKIFAKRVAYGDFNFPLEIEKSNYFGAFTESFDLMREELKTAKENEYKANKSKKELVASLSHDIKTPIASIMSATDLMYVKAQSEDEKKTINLINQKLEQINSLVTNMFHATLEELEALKVSPVEITSEEVRKIILNADYENKVLPFQLPSSLIIADPFRLQQVFDNIITNSYKYAKTDIDVKSGINEDFLCIEIIDFGAGVQGEELPLIFNKFYRGKNIVNSNGYGLGLYLSRYFVNLMEGEIYCENMKNGFSINIKLKLS